MKLNEIFTFKRVLFVLVFAVLSFIGYNINFSAIIGAENQFFTLFQFFGPMTGAFLGPVFGAAAVLLAEVTNYVFLGKAFDLIGILRLFPMIFASVYFFVLSKNAGKEINASKILSFAIPLIAMAAFILHPIGNQAWFYSLYWLIPLIVLLLPRNLFLRSLGATFTAHAIGSILWLYTIPMEASQWVLLIPVVAFERIVFALGISLSFIAVTTVLSRIEAIVKSNEINIDLNYAIGNKLKA
ncbi:MAG: hypothetical protein ABIA76_05315 [Candidatus Diapherotrites archaeon]